MSFIEKGGVGVNARQQYPVGLLTAFHKGMQSRASELSHSNKVLAVLGSVLWDRFGGELYGKGMAVGDALTKAYNDVLEQVDVLVLPTLSYLPPKLPASVNTLGEDLAAGTGMDINPLAFNISGHPAITVPVNPIDGLPVGMMVVGRHWEDDVVLSVAKAWETLRGC